MAKQIEAQDAKQGRQGNYVLVILTVSLGLVAIAWIGVEVYGQLIGHGL